MDVNQIKERYNELAETNCCLSCGGAINYTKVKEGDVCIDLGSGRGNDVIRLAESVGKTGHVYGVDCSEQMIEKAKKTAEKLDVHNVSFVFSDLEKINLPDSIANCIISNCTINHVSDKQSTWNEIYRLLKKSGHFVVSDIYATKDVPEIYKNDPKAVAECWAGAVTKDVYLQQLKKAGFIDITIIEESQPYEKGSINVCSFTIYGKKPCCQK